jgi:cytoskeletal protein RodZ
MGDLGGVLRGAREERQLTLTAVSDRTKIPRRILEKLEQNAFSELPPGPATRGYLRAFACEVGLDGEWVLDYARPHLAADVDVFDQLRTRYEMADRFQRAGHKQYALIQLLLVIACLAGLFYALTAHDRAQTASTETPPEVWLDPTVAS